MRQRLGRRHRRYVWCLSHSSRFEQLVLEGLGIERLREEKALHFANILKAEMVDLFDGLDAFGQRLESEVLAQLDKGVNKGVGFSRSSDGLGKGPIDLETIDRETLEIGEARVAGAEIVDGDLDTEVFQVSQPSRRQVDVAHKRSFGYFDGQVLRTKTTRLERLPNVLDDDVPVELSPRNVDGDDKVTPAPTPGRHLRAGLGQHPLPDFYNLAARLEEWDELIRLNLTQRRVLPPDEGFDADQREVIEVVDRLVDEPELPIGERGTEVEVEYETTLDLRIHLGTEDGRTVLTSRFCLVQRHIGITQ